MKNPKRAVAKSAERVKGWPSFLQFRSSAWHAARRVRADEREALVGLPERREA